MHKFSLQYLGTEVEQQYRSILQPQAHQALMWSMQLLALMDACWLGSVAISTGTFDKRTMGPIIVFGVLVLLAGLMACCPKFQDWWQLMVQITLNGIWVLFRLSLPISYGDSYKIGYIVAYSTQWYLSVCYQSFNLGSRTSLKLLSISINIVQIVGMDVATTGSFSVEQMLLMLAGVMCMYHIHSDDRGRRLSYLIQYQQELWEQHLDEVGEIGIMQCTYDKRLNSLRLNKSNKIASHQFQIRDEASFKEFSRNFIVMLPSTAPSLQEGKIKLEQLLYYMFADEEKRTHLLNTSSSSTMNSQLFQAKGIYQTTNYRVQVFSFWRPEQIAVIQISKFEETLEVKTMKFKLQILRLAVQTYQQQLQSTLLPSLAILKKLYYNDYKASTVQPDTLHKLFSLAEYRLYETFRVNLNILIFFRPKFAIRYQIFDPSHAIENAIHVLRHKILKRGFKIITEHSPLPIRIVSNYQLFSQVIFNILEQIMSVSKRGGEVCIIFQRRLNSPCEYLDLSVVTNATSANDLLEHQIWVLNPLSLKNCRRVSVHKQLHINLCISHYIVGLIGPYSKIEYIQDDEMCSIQFKVYTNLKEMKASVASRRRVQPMSAQSKNPVSSVPPSMRQNDSIMQNSASNLALLNRSNHDFY